MAQNPANIHIGAARIFLGVTPPATSTGPGEKPEKLAHTDGVPETGVEVGYTQDAATFTYKQNKQEVVAEQSLNPVDVFVVSEEIQIEFTAMEHVYNTLKTAFDNVGSDDNETEMLFYGGDGGQLVSVTTQCVALTSRIRTSPTKFEVLTIYRVYNMEGVSIGYNRTGEAIYKITLKGLTDTSRVQGDRLFQWFKEKAPATATGAVAGSPGTWTPAGSGAPLNASAMGPVIANPLTPWTGGQHMVLGDSTKVHWNGTAWVSGQAPAVIAATGATSGNPGSFTPSGAQPPANLSAMSSVTATPSTAWVTGAHVVLADASHAHWNNAIWVVGDAP